jgi:hypothetical protein
MKNNTAQKILITGVRRTPGSIVYIRKVSGDLNEICMSDAKRAPAQRVVRIIVQVNFHRTPGYLYYVDSDGDVACVKRGLRGPAKQKKQPRGAKRPSHVQPQPQKPAGGTDYIALVLDDSGSMSGIASAAHRAFNGIIDGIIAESVGRSVFVSLYKFGTQRLPQREGDEGQGRVGVGVVHVDVVGNAGMCVGCGMGMGMVMLDAI